MGNTFYRISDKDLFHFVLKEQECNRRKSCCNQKCDKCTFGTDYESSVKYYSQLREILQARNPELYFANTLDELHTLIGRKKNDYQY